MIKIFNDADLHIALSMSDYEINNRIFVKVQMSNYESKIDPDLGDGRRLMSDQFVNHTPHLDVAYVMLGETIINSDGSPSGGRDFVNNPYKKDEIDMWVQKYGVENTHLDFPRPEVIE